MPRFETSNLAICQRMRRRGDFLSTFRYLSGRLLRELGKTQEYDPPPSIGTHSASNIVEVSPQNFAVVSHDDNGVNGFHLFYADPFCFSSWKLSSTLPGPLHPTSELGSNQFILLLSDGLDQTKVWVTQYVSGLISPYGLLQPGGRIKGKHATGYDDVALVTDDWKMHRYHAGSQPGGSALIEESEALQGYHELYRANVFHSSDALLEYLEPGKGSGLIWAHKFMFVDNGDVQYSPFNFYGQAIESRHLPGGHRPLLGSSYKMFSWTVGHYCGFPVCAKLLITGGDSVLRIYYFSGTGNQWALLKYRDGTQLTDFYSGSVLYPWDVFAFSPASEGFDGHGDLWIIGVAQGGRTVKIRRITPNLDIGEYSVQEDTTYVRGEDVADVIWYRGVRSRLIHIELARTGNLRIVLD